MSSAEERPDPSRSSTQQNTDEPVEPNGHHGGESAAPAAAADHPEEQSATQLTPIPPEGTAAPASEHGDFGQSSPTSPSDTNASPSETNAGGSGAGPQPGGAPASSAGAGDSTSNTSGSGTGGNGEGPPPGRGTLGEEDRRKLLTRGRLALVLGVGGLIFSIPLFPLGLALGVSALVLGSTARRRGRAANMAVPGARVGFVLGIVATVLASVATAIALLFYDELVEWQDCLGAANTRSGEEICQDTFQDRLNDRLDTLTADIPGR